MKRTIKIVVLAVCLALFPSMPPAAAGEADDEARFVVLVNELRANEGLKPLAIHEQLVGPSHLWALTMSDLGTLSHAADLSTGISAYWTKLGENVGVSSKGQVQELFDAFVASPTHYENLVDPLFEYLGIAVVYDDQGRMWTTHRFMALGEPTPISPQSTESSMDALASTSTSTDTTSSTSASETPSTTTPSVSTTSNAPTTDTASATPTETPELGELDAPAVISVMASLANLGI